MAQGFIFAGFKPLERFNQLWATILTNLPQETTQMVECEPQGELISLICVVSLARVCRTCTVESAALVVLLCTSLVFPCVPGFGVGFGCKICAPNNWIMGVCLQPGWFVVPLGSLFHDHARFHHASFHDTARLHYAFF